MQKQATFNRQAFNDALPKGDGKYFRLKLEKGESVKIRFLPWIFNRELVPALPHICGWEESSKKTEGKKKPHRFELGESIPDGIQWAKGEEKFGGKPQFPKPVMGGLVYVYGKEPFVGVSEFGQTSISTSIFNYIDPEQNAFLKKGLWNYDIVISRISETQYKVDLHPESDPLGQEHLDALYDFLGSENEGFSWENYMRSQNPFEKGFLLDDVEFYLELQGKHPTNSPQEKKKEKTVKEKSSEEGERFNIDDEDFKFNEDWKKVVTAKGTEIGKKNYHELIELLNLMKSKGTNSGKVWDAICSGIKDLGEEIPF